MDRPPLQFVHGHPNPLLHRPTDPLSTPTHRPPYRTLGPRSTIKYGRLPRATFAFGYDGQRRSFEDSTNSGTLFQVFVWFYPGRCDAPDGPREDKTKAADKMVGACIGCLVAHAPPRTPNNTPSTTHPQQHPLPLPVRMYACPHGILGWWYALPVGHPLPMATTRLQPLQAEEHPGVQWNAEFGL